MRKRRGKPLTMHDPILCIASRRVADDFPDVEEALAEPDGLLAAGGNLEPARLLRAYRRGIFPWYEEGQPILWWSPDPRSVILPDEIHISRSLRKVLKREPFRICIDEDFEAVVRACAEPRCGQRGTWLSPVMIAAYCRLHEEGHAHCLECWEDDLLVGGLYGVAIGQVFFGESMFSRRPDASKIALVHLGERLRAWGYRLIDCQVHSAHLERMGAQRLPRKSFTDMLQDLCNQAPDSCAWKRTDDM